MAEIKIRELSIGDWVRVDDFDKVLIKRVSAIDGTRNQIGIKNNRSGIYWYYDDEFEPIPLTPEILEKNGFEENCGRWYNSEALMEFEQYKDGWDRTINCGEYSVYFIKYVHQLQHALRLAGVEKEIEV
jgi:hypothetical protein